MTTEALTLVFRWFEVEGEVVSIEPHGAGHIHDTYAAVVRAGGHTPRRYLLQRINTHVFQDPQALMDNLVQVTSHLRRRYQRQPLLDDRRRSLRLVLTRDGESFLDGGEIGAWRVFEWIERTRPCPIPPPRAEAYEAAFLFGEYQRHLADLPPPRLAETIPGFHDTPRRISALAGAVDSDPLNRAASVRREIDDALARVEFASSLERMLKTGALQERVTHNDAKMNNALIDERTGRGICVIDLDTTMHGIGVLDFGELVRSGVFSAAEDEPDPKRIRLRQDVFERISLGYLAGIGEAIAPVERESMVLAARLMVFENGVRFLTDFLDGDRYFKVHRPSQNLDRCRVHFAMLALLEQNEETLRSVVEKAASRGSTE